LPAKRAVVTPLPQDYGRRHERLIQRQEGRKRVCSLLTSATAKRSQKAENCKRVLESVVMRA
jgi:hypothetical protein